MFFKLGAKKGGGLGAQRVKTDFAKIEKKAEQNDQMRLEATVAPSNPEDQEKTVSFYYFFL